MDKESLEQALAEGQTVRMIAEANSVTVNEVLIAIDDNNLEFPEDSYIQKLRGTTLQEPGAPFSLIYDDPRCTRLNGWDVENLVPSQMRPQFILDRFHKSKCYYSGVETDSYKFVDGNQANYMITNLLPISQEEGERRFGAPNPQASTNHNYTMEFAGRRLNVKLHITGQIDSLVGAPFDQTAIDAAFHRWVIDHFHNADPKMILPDVPSTLECIAYAVWRQVTQRALVKGVHRIDVASGSSEATVSAPMVLNLYNGLIRSQLAQQPNLVAPNAGNTPPAQGSPIIL